MEASKVRDAAAEFCDDYPYATFRGMIRAFMKGHGIADKRYACFRSDILAAVLEASDYDQLYKRIMGVLDEYDV